jgi:hypothetical protein
MLNRKISLDKKVAELSKESAILYTWTIPHLDCEGKIHADPSILKGVVVPYLKYMTLKIIERCLQELANSSLVVVYGDGCKYMKFQGFEKNQSIKEGREAASDIPDPTPAELLRNSCVTPAELPLKISKDKLSKDKGVDPTPPTEIYNYYSKTIKPGAKEDAIKNIMKLLKTGFSKADLLGRVDAYAKQLQETGKQDKQYYIQANNFFGEKARYKDYEPIKKIEYKDADPNCKLCKGQGKYLIANTSELKICGCRIKGEK